MMEPEKTKNPIIGRQVDILGDHPRAGQKGVVTGAALDFKTPYLTVRSDDDGMEFRVYHPNTQVRIIQNS